jgi:hypothetical protein
LENFQEVDTVEKVWGALEQHWNGSILDNIESVLGFAKSMTWICMQKESLLGILELT